MNLCIDVGNSHVKMGVFSEGNLVQVFKLATDLLVSESWESQLKAIQSEFPGIKSGILSSVVDLPEEVINLLDFLDTLLILNSSTKVNFFNFYHSPETLGLDRVAAIAGASSHLEGEAGLIINAGTCITYDFLSREKEYYGGAISPGIWMRGKALHTFTAKLPLVNLDFSSMPDFIGTNTEKGLQAGIMWGVFHEIKGFIDQYKQNNSGMRIILAGGDANFLDTHLKNTIFAHQIKWMPDLVLIGLNRILTIQDA